ncbi:hypothetical protein [Natronorubrum halalkaliphilum]|nr:hypothetical protein [Natronorubrum halalkaliphilum]
MEGQHPRLLLASRGITSIQSGIILFGISILLSFFMAAVIFLNGA